MIVNRQKFIKSSGVLCLMIFSLSGFSQEKQAFKDLGNHSESFEMMQNSFQLSSSLNVVQKRWLPKKYLSEVSWMVSSTLKGFNYLNTVSLDGSYRFYLNTHWSVNLKYSYFLNQISPEGKSLLFNLSKNPLELEHAQKQSYSLGVDWYPFYGKIALLNRAIHFDIYTSIAGGFVELLRLDNQRFPLGSVSMGLVFWWNKYLNTRFELSGSYYKYNSHLLVASSIEEHLSKFHIAIGCLF